MRETCPTCGGVLREFMPGEEYGCNWCHWSALPRITWREWGAGMLMLDERSAHKVDRALALFPARRRARAEWDERREEANAWWYEASQLEHEACPGLDLDFDNGVTGEGRGRLEAHRRQRVRLDVARVPDQEVRAGWQHCRGDPFATWLAQGSPQRWQHVATGVGDETELREFPPLGPDDIDRMFEQAGRRMGRSLAEMVFGVDEFQATNRNDWDALDALAQQRADEEPPSMFNAPPVVLEDD